MFDEVCGCELCGCVGDIQQVMGDIFFLVGGYFVCADIKPLVYLHRVTVDDFSVEFFGKEDGCGTFSYSSGA